MKQRESGTLTVTMANAPRNLVVPVSLIAITACMLLLALTVWLREQPRDATEPAWRAADEPAAHSSGGGLAAPAPSQTESAPPPKPVDGAGQRAAPAENEAGIADAIGNDGEGSAVERLRLPGVQEEAKRATEEPNAEVRSAGSVRPMSSGGAGGGGPSPRSPERGASADTGGAESTFVAIPTDEPQPSSSRVTEPGKTPEAEHEPVAETPADNESASEPPAAPSSPDEDPNGAESPDREPLHSTPIVQLIPDALELSVGDPLTVVVAISGASGVGHVPFHLLHNPQVLRFDSGEDGGFLGSDGRQTAFLAAAAAGGGSVVVGLSRMGGGEGISGDGPLCILHYTAIGPGSAAFEFAREKVRNSNSEIVPSVFIPAAVTVR